MVMVVYWLLGVQICMPCIGKVETNNKCELLSENPTCLHFPATSFYMTFCCPGGKTNVEVSTLSGKYFWSYSNRQREEQNNRFV